MQISGDRITLYGQWASEPAKWSILSRTLPEREKLLTQFDKGDIQVLVAIKCLDEGVDVPSTKVAFILASSTNPREFVQRRGRILRKAEGKDRAVIYDFLVVPPPERLDLKFFADVAMRQTVLQNRSFLKSMKQVA